VQKPKAYFADFKSASPFPTPSGKIELYSHELELAGHRAHAHYEPVEEPPEGYFRLLYGRHPVHTFAKTQNTPLLSELYPENDSGSMPRRSPSRSGIKDGDYGDGWRTRTAPAAARSRSRQPSASAPMRSYGARLRAERAAPDRAHGKGASDAALQTKYALDPISGGAGMRVNFVRIAKEK
jgi:thiosulfate reductase / polysulfide reductase chain A